MKPEFKITNKPEGSSLIITGDLTVQFSEQFKNQLNKFYPKNDKLELSLVGITSVDVTSIQLIHTFKSFIKSNNKRMTVLSPENSDVTELLKKTGLIKILSNEVPEISINKNK